MVKSVRTIPIAFWSADQSFQSLVARARSMDQRLLADIGVEGFVESHQDPLAQIAGLR